jgi:hypothetical protein
VAPLGRDAAPTKVITVGLLDVKVTVVVATKPLAFATIIAVPRLFELVNVTVEVPVASVGDAADRVPALVEKFTTTPAAGFPVMSVTTARTVVEVPVAIDAAPVVRTTPFTAMVAALETMLTTPTLALLVVVLILSVPAAAPAV